MGHSSIIKKFAKLSLVVFFLILISNQANAGRRVVLTDLSFELSEISFKDVSIIIWDQRPQVVDRSNPEFFIGYIRSITAIAWPYYIKGEGKLATTLGEKLASAYNEKGANVSYVESSAFDNRRDIIEIVNSQENNKVLLIKLNKLHFDGVAKIEYVVDIELQLLDKEGEVLFKDQRIEKIPMGGAGKHKKTIPATLKTIFELTLNKERVVNAINAEIAPPMASMPDIILKKNGEEVSVSILEIDEKVIRYKPINHLDGPIRVMNLTDVFMITYKNGIKEVIK